MTKKERKELEKQLDYLPKKWREKFFREAEAYDRLWRKLRKTHAGKWVAIHNGEVIDVDDDGGVLYDRVRAKYGDEAIFFTQVDPDSPTGPVYEIA